MLFKNTAKIGQKGSYPWMLFDFDTVTYDKLNIEKLGHTLNIQGFSQCYITQRIFNPARKKNR